MSQTPHIHSLAYLLAQRQRERAEKQAEFLARLPKKKQPIKKVVTIGSAVPPPDLLARPLATTRVDPITVKKASSYPAAKAARQSLAAGMTPRNALPDLSITAVDEEDYDTEPATPVSLTA